VLALKENTGKGPGNCKEKLAKKETRDEKEALRGVETFKMFDFK